MSDDLLTYARETVGLPMRGMHGGRHVGYTTDEEKAKAMRKAGAIVYRCAGPAPDQPVSKEAIPVSVVGYEVSLAKGAPIVRRVEP